MKGAEPMLQGKACNTGGWAGRVAWATQVERRSPSAKRYNKINEVLFCRPTTCQHLLSIYLSYIPQNKTHMQELVLTYVSGKPGHHAYMNAHVANVIRNAEL